MIRTRFAPSPTGSLHVGNARIAVLNWLFTRRHSGTVILRIEDTDMERNVSGAEAGIHADLLWLGLDWDEGPGQGGSYGPYRQSERSSIYTQRAEQLRGAGAAYLCFCPPDSAPEATADRRARCACAGFDPEDAAARAQRQPASLRFRVPTERTIAFDDVVRGRIVVAAAEIADFVLLRSDGRPTYNFAVVVDDIEMRVTHVIRGVGHLSNMPRQVLLFEAFDAQLPVVAHVPMVLGADRQKLSKRHGAAGMSEYRAQGYHPDALVNYLSLLSWSSPGGDEVLTRERLIAEISLERIGAADVIFDPVKLRWLSAKHIERMPLEELVAAVRPFMDAVRYPLDEGRLRAAVAATRTHFATFADVNEQLGAFFPAAGPDAGGAVSEQGQRVLSAAVAVLDAVETWTEAALKNALEEVGRRAAVKGRALYEPLRLALTGREHGPPLPATLFVQGREGALNHLRAAAGIEAEGA